MLGRTISHYKIESRIGAGGMGEVYRARDLNLPRDVALKFLPLGNITDEVAKTRFKREAEAASALDHPNICTIYEIDETAEGQLFIAMAHYDGESLSERIQRGPLDIRAAFQITGSIANGLGSAHRASIVHRDIKPNNVMITSEGFVKIVDFGVAKLADATRVTKTNYTVGTMSYMSPQQATGSVVDNRSDIWSLGVVFYEMLVGSLPFTGDVYEALLYNITHNDPVPPHERRPEIPEAVSAIVMKCLQKDVEDRYESVDDLIRDMDHAARELGWGSSTVVPIAPDPQPPPPVWPKIVAALAVFSVLIVAGYLARSQLYGVYERFFVHPEEIFTTENRIAILPIENMIGSSEDVFVDGLSELVSAVAEETVRGAPSTWVVPHDRVAGAPVAAPTDAVGAFGVNQIVIGNLQRFGRKSRIKLRLFNAKDMREIRSVDVDYDPVTGEGFTDGIAGKVAELLGIVPAPGESLLLGRNPGATLDYVHTIGWLQRYRTDAAAIDSATSYAVAMQTDNNHALGRLSMGRVLQTRYELDKDERWLQQALEQFEPLIAAYPGDPYPSIYSADACYDLGQYEQAIAHCQKALSIVPGQPKACLRLGWTYHRQDRYDEAESAMRAAVIHYPDYWATEFELGVLYYFHDRLDHAIAAWKRALEFAPNDMTVLNNIGAVYYVRDDWATAREYFQRAFQISPTCDTCSNIALLLYYEQDFEQSAAYYEFAIEYCDTTDFLVWGNLASAQYWTEGQRDAAARTYKTAIRHAERELRADPENPNIVSPLISYYSMSGDEENASRMIDYGLRVAGESNKVLYSIGHAYEKRDERQRALRYIGEALRRGYALSEIERTPMLNDLVEDDRFKRMVASELSGGSAEDGSQE